VDQVGEAELSAKFGRGELLARQPALGSLTAMQMMQDGREIGARARAFIPLNLVAQGMVTGLSPDADLVVSIVRVDGRRIFRRSLRATGAELTRSGTFQTKLEFDPLLLAAGLYRFEVALLCEQEAIDMISRVVEILDEAGQFGGQPVLYCPPIMKAERIGDLE
jgi:lipopolysaccharide transport system ATP-binding protein